MEKPTSEKYSLKRIGWELERTAMGDGYCGNALLVAKDILGLTNQDRAVLDRYATGSQHDTDHIALQDIATRVYATSQPAPAVQGEPVEFDYPDFHELGMGCGLEDRNITDRYEAMRYGWDKALDRVAEIIDGLGPLYAAPQPAPDVAALEEALEASAHRLHEQPDGEDDCRCGQCRFVRLRDAALAAHRKQGGEP